MRLILVAALAWAGLGPALPQAAKSKLPPLPPIPPPALVEPAPPPPPPTPPYEAQLDRLAEILGTLAYMRDLCGAGDGPTWHDKMATLLDAESETGTRKERLAGSYNRGYEGYRLIYRTCTPSARAVIARSLDEGAAIANQLSVRFGGE